MIDWCDEEYNFWPTDINLSSAEEKWLEEEVVKKGFKRFTQTGLVPYYMALRIRKKKVVSVLMTGFIYLHCSLPTNAPNNMKTYIF